MAPGGQKQGARSRGPSGAIWGQGRQRQTSSQQELWGRRGRAFPGPKPRFLVWCGRRISQSKGPGREGLASIGPAPGRGQEPDGDWIVVQKGRRTGRIGPWGQTSTTSRVLWADQGLGGGGAQDGLSVVGGMADARTRISGRVSGWSRQQEQGNRLAMEGVLSSANSTGPQGIQRETPGTLETSTAPPWQRQMIDLNPRTSPERATKRAKGKSRCLERQARGVVGDAQATSGWPEPVLRRRRRQRGGSSYETADDSEVAVFQRHNHWTGVLARRPESGAAIGRAAAGLAASPF